MLAIQAVLVMLVMQAVLFYASYAPTESTYLHTSPWIFVGTVPFIYQNLVTSEMDTIISFFLYLKNDYMCLSRL